MSSDNVSYESIDRGKLPKHVAVIMDGNGRWAKRKGLMRVKGHQSGVVSVRDTVEAAAEIGIEFLTLYAFSTENWARPKAEVDALMELLIATLRQEMKTLQDNKIRLRTIGDVASLPEQCRKDLDHVESATAENDRMTLILALSYSARWEWVQSTKAIAAKVLAGEIQIDDIDESLLASNLQTSFAPDPELLIRTSGEQRISNFLLWQIAYAELYFTPVLWPDFRKPHFVKAIEEYQKRERRFGKTSEQLKQSNEVI
jgi:undecaprenyl diphosphate synthase